jgi:hypothetical protein
MTPKPKLEVLSPLPREHDPAAFDAFHEDRVLRDLERFAGEPGVFAQYVERARIRCRKAGERAILEYWVAFYEAGERLISAKAGLAKLHADIEEQGLRRDKVAYQRRHLERFVEKGAGTASNENEQKFNESFRRREMDTRWDVHESLRPLQTLIELQHWRRHQRDRILDDRSLSSQEQSEDLQFVDDLYAQKRAELKVDTRIFEE